jgi:hypothetical protein
LYSSDLFTIRKDFVFLSQHVSEAVDAVAREHLDVTTAFGMHYDPLTWAAVLKSAAPPQRTPDQRLTGAWLLHTRKKDITCAGCYETCCHVDFRAARP